MTVVIIVIIIIIVVVIVNLGKAWKDESLFYDFRIIFRWYRGNFPRGREVQLDVSCRSQRCIRSSSSYLPSQI